MACYFNHRFLVRMYHKLTHVAPQIDPCCSCSWRLEVFVSYFDSYEDSTGYAISGHVICTFVPLDGLIVQTNPFHCTLSLSTPRYYGGLAVELERHGTDLNNLL